MYASFTLFCCYGLGRSALTWRTILESGTASTCCCWRSLAGRPADCARTLLARDALARLRADVIGHVTAFHRDRLHLPVEARAATRSSLHDLGVFAAQDFTLAAIVLLFTMILDRKTGTTRSNVMRILWRRVVSALSAFCGSVFLIWCRRPDGIHTVYLPTLWRLLIASPCILCCVVAVLLVHRFSASRALAARKPRRNRKPNR